MLTFTGIFSYKIMFNMFKKVKDSLKFYNNEEVKEQFKGESREHNVFIWESPECSKVRALHFCKISLVSFRPLRQPTLTTENNTKAEPEPLRILQMLLTLNFGRTVYSFKTVLCTWHLLKELAWRLYQDNLSRWSQNCHLSAGLLITEQF